MRSWIHGALCSLFTLHSGMIMGQSGVIQGHLTLDDDPLSNISVFLMGSDMGTITDMEGFYSITDLPPGEHTLFTSGLGFKPIEKPFSINGQDTIELDLELEEEVMGLPAAVVQSVSLTGGLKGIRSIPGSAHYISPQELAKGTYTDINRALRSIPGINLQEEDGYGLRPNIGLRGSGSERSSKITVMEDGVLAAPAPYAAPAAYYFPTIGRMHALEILKGSSQIRFGPYTTGGAVNLISRPIPSHFSGQINMGTGSFGSRHLSAFVGSSHKHFGYSVESFQYSSDGFKSLPVDRSTGFDKKDYLAKFRINSGPDAHVFQSLLMKVGIAEEISNETYLGLSQQDFEQKPFMRYAASQRDRMTTSHQQYSLRHQLQLPGHWDVVTTAYLHHFKRNWYKLDKVVDDQGMVIGISSLLEEPIKFERGFHLLHGENIGADARLLVKANNRSYKSMGIQSQISHQFGGGNWKHHLDLGWRFHYDEMDRFQWVDTYSMKNESMMLRSAGIPGSESNRIQGAHAFASFIQYKVRHGHFTIIPGLRYEHISLNRQDFGKEDVDRTGADLIVVRNRVDVVIPGIGVDFKVMESLSLLAGVHRGFSPPGTNEGSLPEKSINLELGARIKGHRVQGQWILFQNHYDNLLGSDLAASGGTGTTDLFNGGKALARGFETQWTWQVLKNLPSMSLPLTLVYTLTDATFSSNFASDFEGWGTVSKDDQLPYLARHQATLSGEIVLDKWSWLISARCQSAMLTAAGRINEEPSREIDPYLLVDSHFHFKLHQKVTVYLSGKNLLNNTYLVARRPAGLRPGLPRTIMLGIKARF